MFLRRVIAQLLMGGTACCCARRGSQINAVKELNWWVGGCIYTVRCEAGLVAGPRPNVRPVCQTFRCQNVTAFAFAVSIIVPRTVTLLSSSFSPHVPYTYYSLR
jgi:hypothetical protein